MTDFLTLAIAPHHAGKVITPHNNRLSIPRLWRFDTVPWSGVADLWSLLEQLAGAGCVALIRGWPLVGAGPRRGSNFRDCVQRWLPFDLDAPDLPDLGPEAARATLGTPWCDCACWWQRTSSAGVKAGSRYRFVFVLDQGCTNAAAKQFVTGRPGLDPCIYNAGRLLFLAVPRFVGRADPFSADQRSGVLPGQDVAPQLPCSVQAPPRRQVTRSVSGESYAQARASVAHTGQRILLAQQGTRQNTLVKGLAWVVLSHAAIGQDPTTVLQYLCELALTRRPDDTKRIHDALTWALKLWERT